MSATTAAHVRSISDTFHLPHIQTRWDYSWDRGASSVNLHPHPAVLSKAYADLVEEYGWKSLVIVYENEESLIRLQELLKFPKHYEGVKITLKQLNTLTDDYRPMLKEIFYSGETRIVLDCSFDKIEEVLRQANEIGLINDYFNYMITSLDLERLDLADYKYSGVNITGYRMFDSSSPQIAAYLKKWISIGDGKGLNHPLHVS